MISARPLSFPNLLSSPKFQTVRRAVRARGIYGTAIRHDEIDRRASDKLLEDAAREEAEETRRPARPSRAQILEDQNQNWTGDESVQDAVLRMLVDKYKPLRSGSIQTAEEKLRAAPPKVSVPESDPLGEGPSQFNAALVVEGAQPGESSTQPLPPPRTYVPGEPILPGIEGHQPWHTTFKVPSHATSNVHYGQIPRQPSRKVDPPPIDDKERRKQREVRRRTEHAGRLSRARESTLDYRLGIRGGAAMHRPNPTTLKGWTSLVEDRIQRAREEGLFNSVKGRGQPLAFTTQDRNPFIAREEFLMNRIVQRQGAAPPWVEVQGEMESAIASFREIIRQSWTRRAIRLLTASQPAAQLPQLQLDEVSALRDAEWEARERAFHDHALEEVNALVRKYNGLAPYAVRRAYYMRDTELEKTYRDSAEDILQGLADRVASSSNRKGYVDVGSDEDSRIAGSAVTPLAPLSFRQMFRELWTTLRGR
ncbi:uncharacterized protein B0H18DRAFT_1003826 [Fomitopsis serialis]|uniref:uncharacterized protein n=1 Tax=Fomitopsis serialis TaxID=139415 RepID=UPI0020073224|nr:uncharacterized protein B0H18DRAFT_1003826 [Neoantrodia serialis]KAH9927274.1 hypothetical protein B0H18DRAFT_1003826 [Neoantrodia serialis]